PPPLRDALPICRVAVEVLAAAAAQAQGVAAAAGGVADALRPLAEYRVHSESRQVGEGQRALVDAHCAVFCAAVQRGDGLAGIEQPRRVEAALDAVEQLQRRTAV